MAEEAFVLWTLRRQGRTAKALLQHDPEPGRTGLIFTLDESPVAQRYFGAHEQAALFSTADQMRTGMEATGWVLEDEDS
jgi:hypothetical protein